MTSHECNVTNETDICKAADAMHPVMKFIIAVIGILGIVYAFGVTNQTRDSQIKANLDVNAKQDSKIEALDKQVQILDKKSAVTDTKLDSIMKTLEKVDEKLDKHFSSQGEQ